MGCLKKKKKTVEALNKTKTSSEQEGTLPEDSLWSGTAALPWLSSLSAHQAQAEFGFAKPPRSQMPIPQNKPVFCLQPTLPRGSPISQDGKGSMEPAGLVLELEAPVCPGCHRPPVPDSPVRSRAHTTHQTNPYIMLICFSGEF